MSVHTAAPHTPLTNRARAHRRRLKRRHPGLAVRLSGGGVHASQGAEAVQGVHGRGRGRGVPAVRPPHHVRQLRAGAARLPALSAADPRHRAHLPLVREPRPLETSRRRRRARASELRERRAAGRRRKAGGRPGQSGQEGRAARAVFYRLKAVGRGEIPPPGWTGRVVGEKSTHRLGWPRGKTLAP